MVANEAWLRSWRNRHGVTAKVKLGAYGLIRIEVEESDGSRSVVHFNANGISDKNGSKLSTTGARLVLGL
jgi:hypothetical protein